jgi:hypothetical protein
LARIFDDAEHSEHETRELVIGHSAAGRLLIVSFTEHLPEHVRIISALRRQGRKKEPMKKRSEANPDLAPEYRFDYTKARPNRFAGKPQVRPVVVVLAPDVAQVFRDAKSVNAVLRSIVKAMPGGPAER